MSYETITGVITALTFVLAVATLVRTLALVARIRRQQECIRRMFVLTATFEMLSQDKTDTEQARSAAKKVYVCALDAIASAGMLDEYSSSIERAEVEKHMKEMGRG